MMDKCVKCEYRVFYIICEWYFYLASSKKFITPNLSLQVINSLIDIFTEKELVNFEQIMEKFVKSNMWELSEVLNKEYITPPTFITQPESLMIFYLFETHKEQLIDVWVSVYGETYLEDMANLWGTTLDL
jgi:protein-tyrosine phosphatase